MYVNSKFKENKLAYSLMYKDIIELRLWTLAHQSQSGTDVYCKTAVNLDNSTSWETSVCTYSYWKMAKILLQSHLHK